MGVEISIPEQRVCERLEPLLRAHAIGDSLKESPNAEEVISAFEYFLPEVLRGAHRQWRYESLDGVYPRIFRKTGDREAELLGLAILISDQTLTPVYLQLQLSPTFDRVDWLDLRLGEHSQGLLRREPYSESEILGTMLHVVERFESIDWHYHVSYGERK